MTGTFRIYILQSYNSKRKTFKLPKNQFLNSLLELKVKNLRLSSMIRCAFPFPIVCVPHLGINILWNTYNASIGSESLRLFRATSDINTLVTLHNFLLKRMQKQGSKQRSIISMLNKIFYKHFTVFNVFTSTAANLIKLCSLSLIRTMHIQVCFLHSLFLLFRFVCLCACLFSCIFVFLCCYHRIIASVPSIMVSMYLHLFIFLCV